MTAQEHLAAAAREHALADRNFASLADDRIQPPDSLFNVMGVYFESSVPLPAYADEYLYELGDPETYTFWPRVTEPGEGRRDAASDHREKALQHERAAALLEGRPSPTPLPPEQPPLIDQT